MLFFGILSTSTASYSRCSRLAIFVLVFVCGTSPSGLGSTISPSVFVEARSGSVGVGSTRLKHFSGQFGASCPLIAVSSHRRRSHLYIPSGDTLDYRAIRTVYNLLCPSDELQLGVRLLGWCHGLQSTRCFWSPIYWRRADFAIHGPGSWSVFSERSILAAVTCCKVLYRRAMKCRLVSSRPGGAIQAMLSA